MLIHLIGICLLIVLYGFGYLLDYLHKEFGFTIALVVFVIGGISFITFVMGLVVM